jgi:protein SCO1/2
MTSRLPMMMRQLFMGALLVAALLGCRKSELPRLYAIPNAALIDDGGRATSLASLQGKVVIYDFIFTRCGGTCPVMTRRMKTLITELPSDDLRFVSISVDPSYDRPAVLKAYADGVRTDSRWLFLTGEEEAIRNLSLQGFKLAAGGKTNSATEPILHSTKFVLADRQGVIRAYYDSNDPAAREKVARDARDLLAE